MNSPIITLTSAPATFVGVVLTFYQPDPDYPGVGVQVYPPEAAAWEWVCS